MRGTHQAMHHRLRSAVRRTVVFLLVSAPLRAQSTGDWEFVGPPGISAGQAVCAQIRCGPDGNPLVIYQDQTGAGGHAVVQRFDGAGWSSVGTPGQASLGDAWYNPLRFDDAGNLYFACRDYQVGGNLSVRRFALGGSAWTSVGPNAASSSQAHYTALEIGPGGMPYVAYADRGTTPRDQPSVARFDSTTGQWQYLGPRGITGAPSSYNTIAFDSQSVLYTCFSDRNQLDPVGAAKGTVMRWDEANASWSNVGAPGFTPTAVANLTLAIDHHDHLYIAYYRYHDSLIVMRFDGANWVQVGGSASGSDRPEVESEGWRQWLSLCFDSQDRPYIAYELFDFGQKAAVRCFDGTNWQQVGTHGFSPDVADYLSLTIDTFDVPQVVFVDASQNRKVSVMRYAPSPAVFGVPSPNTLGCTAAISASGRPSLSSGQPFRIELSQVGNQRAGMLLWSGAPAQIPFESGTLYVRPPLHRAGPLASGGNVGVHDCSGNFAYDFNLLLATGNTGLAPGTYGFAQYWYRDGNAGNSALSAGLRFRIEP